MNEESSVVDEDYETHPNKLAQNRKRYKTPEEALKSCLELWEEMHKNKHYTKEGAYEALEKPEDICYCPCCEYDASVATLGASCSHCPMWNTVLGRITPCLVDGSPYLAWTRRKNALPMVLAIKEVISTGQKL